MREKSQKKGGKAYLGGKRKNRPNLHREEQRGGKERVIRE
jgi:hypothetical protein